MLPLTLNLLVYKSVKKRFSGLHDAIDGYITPEQTCELKVVKAYYEDFVS